MSILTSSNKRFAALALGPLSLGVLSKLGLNLDAETMRLLLELTGLYITVSKGGEYLITSAEQKARTAAAGKLDVKALIDGAIAKGKELAGATPPSPGAPQ